MQRSRSIVIVSFLISLLVIFTSCFNSSDSPSGNNSFHASMNAAPIPGSLAVYIHQVDYHEFQRDFPPNRIYPASYEITGTGPNSESFSEISSKPTIPVSGLDDGTWTINVSAKNKTDEVIGTGTGTIDVIGGEGVAVITLKTLYPVLYKINIIYGDGYFKYEYDSSGKIERLIRYIEVKGEDGLSYSGDEPIFMYRQYIYDKGSLIKTIEYLGNGDDESWFTEDDTVFSYSLHECDSYDNIIKEIVYYKAGPDNIWFNEDDIAHYYFKNATYDGNGNRLSTIWCFSPDDKNLWLNDENALYIHELLTHDETGKKLEKKRIHPGPDLTLFTTDDYPVLYFKYDYKGIFNGIDFDSRKILYDLPDQTWDLKNENISNIVFSTVNSSGLVDKIYSQVDGDDNLFFTADDSESLLYECIYQDLTPPDPEPSEIYFDLPSNSTYTSEVQWLGIGLRPLYLDFQVDSTYPITNVSGATHVENNTYRITIQPIFTLPVTETKTVTITDSENIQKQFSYTYTMSSRLGYLWVHYVYNTDINYMFQEN